MKIKINKLGQILKGHKTGWFVQIVPKEDKGYWIFIFKTKTNLEESDNYDYWAEDFNNIKEYFEHFKWEIEWLE